MAIEDEIINISDIDIGTEILRTDKLLVETNNGTKLVEFKDFVIGTDNISFYNVISSAFLGDNITGAAQYQTISGFSLLSPGTNAGYKTNYEHISGAIELTKVNNSAVTELATVSGKIASNESALLGLQTGIAGIYDTLNNTGNEALKTVTKKVSAANFKVAFSGGGSPRIDRNTGLIPFSHILVNPTDTNKDVTFSNAGENFDMTFPSTGDGSFVKSLYLLMGDFKVSYGKNEPFMNKHKQPIQIAINSNIVHECFPTNYDLTREGGTQYYDFSVFSLNTIQLINPGDRLQIFAPGDTIFDKGTSFAGIKMNGV
tara:strand:+ start:406 stop:1350 length:945 start_codon:yes stop_codon:yes gene_type:complete